MRVLKEEFAQISTKELPDPSEFRPENKKEEDFRDYETSPRVEIVRKTYQLMHENQTLEYAKQQRKYWGALDKVEMGVLEALDLLNNLVDDSDPDVDLPNILHAYQTAEKIRQYHPNDDWFHLTGLIHDLGKLIALWGQPQWSSVGDTFPVGCAFSKDIVFSEQFSANPDIKNPTLSTLHGIYEPNCGLDNVIMSYGHDEYLYQVLVGNNCNLPEEALYMIRYHSFYPWHTSGAYSHLTNEKDEKMLPWVKEFNKFDLYTKSDELPDIEKLRPYYQGLVDKYCPGLLRF